MISSLPEINNKSRRAVILKILPAILLLLFILQSGLGMIRESATWDETHSFGLGEYLLKNMKWDVPGSILHPPLSYYISSIPFLFVSDSNDDLWDYSNQVERDRDFLSNVDNQRGQMLLSSDINEGNILFYFSRTMIILTALLLGWYIYLWGRLLYGENGALLSLLFFSFSPNLLAHSHIITPDMVLTTFFLIASFYFWKSLNSVSAKYSIIGGTFLGLALLSKFTGIFLFPILFMFVLFYCIKGYRINILHIILFSGTGIIILFAGYGFNIKPYLQGISFQIEHAGQGHSSFLIGEHSFSGWWYYYIVAFLIKTPIPTLILFFTALGYNLFRFRFSRNMNELFLMIPVFFIFTFFSVMHQSIGLRYILPIYPYIFLMIGGVIRFKINKKLIYPALLLLVGWYISGTLYMGHHYLAYFNELIGGPKNGYKYLVDSNLDWGQDLPGLKTFMDNNNIKSINLSYFGTDLPERYGINYTRLPDPLFESELQHDNIRMKVKGLVAISATNLQGVYFSNKDIYAWFKEHEPAERIGYSIFIYNTNLKRTENK